MRRHEAPALRRRPRPPVNGQSRRTRAQTSTISQRVACDPVLARTRRNLQGFVGDVIGENFLVAEFEAARLGLHDCDPLLRQPRAGRR
jgi:hypothetical protein